MKDVDLFNESHHEAIKITIEYVGHASKLDFEVNSSTVLNLMVFF